MKEPTQQRSHLLPPIFLINQFFYKHQKKITTTSPTLHYKICTLCLSVSHSFLTRAIQAYFLAVLKKLKPQKTQGFKKTQAFFPKKLNDLPTARVYLYLIQKGIVNDMLNSQFESLFHLRKDKLSKFSLKITISKAFFC